MDNHYWFLGWTIFWLINHLIIRWEIRAINQKPTWSVEDLQILKKIDGPPPHLEWQTRVKYKDLPLLLSLLFATLSALSAP